MGRKKDKAPTQPRPKLPKNIVAKIEKHKNAIARHRDALRAILSDVESVVETSDAGVAHLESAIDTLSQYV